MAQRNGFKRKDRMYSRRHKRPRTGANAHTVSMNMARDCKPASRTFLLFRARQSQLQKSSKTVTCGYVKLHNPTGLTGVDHARAKLFSPLPFVPFRSFMHISHLSDACNSDNVCDANRPVHKPADNEYTIPDKSVGRLCTPASLGALQSQASTSNLKNCFVSQSTESRKEYAALQCL